MANTKEIKDRIRSVGDTMKITKAMYMISSNKLRKARKKLAEGEPFFYALQAMIARVLRHMPEDVKSRYLDNGEKREEEKVRAYLVITGDKGLAGAFNHNVLKLADECLANSAGRFRLYLVGEVGRHYYTRKGVPFEEAFHYIVQNPTLSRSRAIRDTLMEAYLTGEVDEIHVVYTVMKNSLTCETMVRKLLPLEPERLNPQAAGNLADIYHEEFLMTPSPEAILDNIVPEYVNGFLYGALMESACSVQNSRMLAMDAANKNAAEMIRELNTRYNRERQAAITQEITEVVSGAKALRRAKEGR